MEECIFASDKLDQPTYSLLLAKMVEIIRDVFNYCRVGRLSLPCLNKVIV